MFCRTLVFLLAGVLTEASFATTQLASTQDAHIQRTLSNPPLAVLDVGSAQLFAGSAGAVGKDRCSVIPVQLPDLGPVNDPFEWAEFSFNYEGKQGTVKGNVDLYGLGRRASPTVLVGDFWTATDEIDGDDATLIAHDAITENSTAYGLKSVSNAALVDYLNAQYAGGAGAGQYVFIRLSVDTARPAAPRVTSSPRQTVATPRRVHSSSTVKRPTPSPHSGAPSSG